MKQVIAVVGPTASGKTALSVAIAKAVDGEIICADSMQVYREMSIATAAAGSEEQEGVPHHLLSFLDPSVSFSVAEYVKLAKAALDDIISRGKTPVFCGGTGLFLDSLLRNVQFVQEAADSSLRLSLLERAQRNGNEALYEELVQIDPLAAQKIHPNNVKRVVRALEVYYATGLRFSEHGENSRSVPSELMPLFIGINYRQRQLLYERINRRVDLMIQAGLPEEAQRLASRTDAATCMQAIGHKELAPYLRQELPLEQAVANLKQATRRYAKRQLTWFRRNEAIHWFYPDENREYTQQAISLAKDFLKGAE